MLAIVCPGFMHLFIIIKLSQKQLKKIAPVYSIIITTMVSASKTTKANKGSKVKTTEKKTKKTTKQVTTPKVETAPPSPTPVTPVVDTVENVVQKPLDTHAIETSMTEVLASFSQSITALTTALAQLKSDFKTVEKQVLKEARTMDKVNAKRNKNKGSRAPSGFVKPAAISPELAKFLGVDSDTKMARTDVTKMITSYVKDNNLQDVNNGRKIVPDAKLKALLNVSGNEEVTYFNLQKFMKPHFVKV